MGNEVLPAHTFWQWRPLVIFLGEKDARDMLEAVTAATTGPAGFDDWVRSWGGDPGCLWNVTSFSGWASDVGLPVLSQSSGQFIDVPAKSAKWPHGKCTPVTAISIWTPAFASAAGELPVAFLLELQVSGCVDNLKKPVHTPCRT